MKPAAPAIDYVKLAFELAASRLGAGARPSWGARLRGAALITMAGLCAGGALALALAAGAMALAPWIGWAGSLGVDAAALGAVGLGLYRLASPKARAPAAKPAPPPLADLVAAQLGAWLRDPEAGLLFVAAMAGAFAAGRGRRD